MMSNTGARFDVGDEIVTKMGGGQDLLKEARLLRHLGHHICPKFRGFYSYDGKDGYSMERCVPIKPPSSDTDTIVYLLRIVRLLEFGVWCHYAVYRTDGWEQRNSDWRRQHAPWIPDELAEYVYWNGESECLTHGDPTLANMVMRGDNTLLCDPLPPRPEFTSTRSVDYGKLLQSAAGWESQLDPQNWHHYPNALLWMIEHTPRIYLKASLFWAAFHCARIAVRSPHHAEWAKSTGILFVENAKDV